MNMRERNDSISPIPEQAEEAPMQNPQPSNLHSLSEAEQLLMQQPAGPSHRQSTLSLNILEGDNSSDELPQQQHQTKREWIQPATTPRRQTSIKKRQRAHSVSVSFDKTANKKVKFIGREEAATSKATKMNAPRQRLTSSLDRLSRRTECPSLPGIGRQSNVVPVCHSNRRQLQSEHHSRAQDIRGAGRRSQSQQVTSRRRRSEESLEPSTPPITRTAHRISLPGLSCEAFIPNRRSRLTDKMLLKQNRELDSYNMGRNIQFNLTWWPDAKRIESAILVDDILMDIQTAISNATGWEPVEPEQSTASTLQIFTYIKPGTAVLALKLPVNCDAETTPK
jgi:hypothetical protein